MGETALERAERQFKQAKARLDAARAREASAERKRDTRRKVILGGALVDLAGRDDRALAMLNRLIDNLPRDRDRESFAGWERPRADEAQDRNGEDRQAETGNGTDRKDEGGSGNRADRPAPLDDAADLHASLFGSGSRSPETP